MIADGVIINLVEPGTALALLMNLLIEYEESSGYKINVSKTLTFNFSPSLLIRQIYNLKWDAKYMKYLGITVLDYGIFSKFYQ